jgi:probable phosphoglycerate mutase
VSRILLLARHGQTEWNRLGRFQGHTDIPLDAEGVRQAAALADAVAHLGVTHVRTSDLSRARETGRIVCERLAAVWAGEDADLRERSFGPFEGLTRDECLRANPEAWASYTADPTQLPPGAETHGVLLARLLRAVARASESVDAGGAILVVSHGGAIRTLVRHWTGENPAPVRNGAVLKVRVTSERIVCEGFL